jgi:hypothetical protein
MNNIHDRSYTSKANSVTATAGPEQLKDVLWIVRGGLILEVLNVCGGWGESILELMNTLNINLFS